METKIKHAEAEPYKDRLFEVLKKPDLIKRSKRDKDEKSNKISKKSNFPAGSF